MEFTMKSESGEHNIKFGVLVEDDCSIDLSYMEKTLDSLLAATKNYDKNKVGVLMSFGDHERPMSETLHLSNFYSAEGVWCRGCNQVRDLNKQEREQTLFQQLVFANYFILLKAGQKVEPTLFRDIDYSINSLGEKNICFEQNGFYAVMKAAVKAYYSEQGDYENTEKYIVETSKSKGFYKKL